MSEGVATPPKDIFHLAEAEKWNDCKDNNHVSSYRPSTYEQDGGFIHATEHVSDLLEVANHFYKTNPNSFLLLRIEPMKLENNSFVTYEATAPVGNMEAFVDGKVKLFPHIYGSLNISAVTKEYEVIRAEDGTFVSIRGLTENS